MKLKEDQQKLKELLRDTITLLCKNGLHFKDEFSVEALIGITLDQENVVLVNIKETIQSDSRVEQSSDSETELRTERTKSRSANAKVSNSSYSKALKRPSNSYISHDAPLKQGRVSDKSKIEDTDDGTWDSDCVIHIKNEREDDADSSVQYLKEQDMMDYKPVFPVPMGMPMTNQYPHSELSDVNTSIQGQNVMHPMSLSSLNESNTGVLPSFPGSGLPGLGQQGVTGNQQAQDPMAEIFDPNTGKFVCSICAKLFSSRGNYKQHLKGLHGLGGTTFVCVCSAKFSWKQSFNKHKTKCSIFQETEQQKMKDDTTGSDDTVILP